jgi:uncharacterized glyoxalase superfamily protein PhnB
MVRNPPEGAPRIVARLAYEDPDAAAVFLEEAFGFPERRQARIANDDGSIALTEIQVLDSHIMLSMAGPHGVHSPRTTGSATQALIVYVDSVDDHYRRAKAAGASIISEPEDQFWGDRRYEASDPEGHLWSFHQHVRDVSREEIEAALRSFPEGK